jgi:ATP-dependent protease ClpP protease subunit
MVQMKTECNKKFSRALPPIIGGGSLLAIASFAAFPSINDHYELIDGETVQLQGIVTTQSARKFTKDFEDATNNNWLGAPITIEIDSIGGNPENARDILYAIEKTGTPVKMECTGDAMSAAATVFLSAYNTISRDASKDCSIMIHEPFWHWDTSDFTYKLSYKEILELHENNTHGSTITLWDKEHKTERTLDYRDIAGKYRRLSKTNEITISRIAENTKLSKADISYLFDTGDTYFTSEQAAFLGMIETIDGAPPTEQQIRQGQQSICSDRPALSACVNLEPNS